MGTLRMPQDNGFDDPGADEYSRQDDPAGRLDDRDILDDPEQQQTDDELGDQPQLTEDTVLWQLDDGTPVTAGEARQGYLREQDYRRKTVLLSQGRQALDSNFSQLTADREAVAQLIIQSLPDLSPQTIAASQMTAAQVAAMSQDRDRMINFVQQLRQRTENDRAGLEQQEQEWARRVAPEVIPDWIDPAAMNRDIEMTRRYLDRTGIPPTTQAKIGRDPYLAKLAVLAAKHEGVRFGGERGRRTQERQRQGVITPSLPAQNQADTAPRSARARDAVRQQARAGATQRERMNAGVQLLRGVEPRQRR
jgi:hypothetical protein